ncbi:MAG TPA: ABC transporter permease [Gemmatimonadales bacterium]|nr:ABC transporter permease [Gemmatimonadales bacterium]
MSFRDFRYALRSLKKSPGFVAVAVLSLGLGLGLVTTMFALLDAVTHPYVAYRDPDHLYSINGWFPTKRVTVNPFDVYRAVRDETRSFAAVVPLSYRLVSVEGPAGTDTTGDAGSYAAVVPARYFDVVGVRPRLGRALREGDAEAGAVVIGYQMWRQWFGARRSLEQMTLTVDRQTLRVVGVMPQGMGTLGSLWLPMPREAERTGAGLRWTSVVARLRPGATEVGAQKELDAVARHLTALYNSPDAPFGFHMGSMRADPMRLTDLHLAMLGASLAVLLIACANLANLMLARGLSKRREIALRLAIGAGRPAVVGQMFAECLVLAAGGVVAGVVASRWGVALVGARVPRDLWWFGLALPRLSWRVFALSFLAAAGAAVLFGLLPAIRVASTVSLDEPLKDGAGTTGRVRQRYSALAVSEVALTLALLMGAGLLLKVVHHIATYDYNFPARRLLQGWLFSPAVDSMTAQDRQAFRLSIAAGLKSVPGVADAAAATSAPAPGGAVTAELTADSTRLLNTLTYPIVTPSWVRTIGLPIVAGRDFEDGDLAADGAVILNSLAAARLYPRESAVGRMLKLGGPATDAPWVRIVGVCRTALVLLDPNDLTSARGEPEVYVVRSTAGSPLHGVPALQTRVIVRAARDASSISEGVRRRLRTFVPGGNAGLLPYLYGMDAALSSRTFMAKLFVTMGAFALVLAAIGLYGVLAYAVSRRIREFAVRIALGAQRADLLKSVLHDGLVMTLAGTGLGAFIALWSSFLLENYLEDVYPTDALTLVLAEAVLIAVTIAACLGPAFRAMRADPIEILRAT